MLSNRKDSDVFYAEPNQPNQIYEQSQIQPLEDNYQVFNAPAD